MRPRNIERAEARLRGDTHFAVGKPCKKGHTSGRYVSSGGCIECSSEIQTRRLDQHNAETRAWAMRNRIKDNALKIAWKLANPDLVRQQARKDRRKWRERNRVKNIAQVRARQLSQQRRTPSWADLDAIERFYVTAAALTKSTGEPWHVDHEIPLHGKTVSGLHVHSNLRVIRKSENLSKGNRFA